MGLQVEAQEGATMIMRVDGQDWQSLEFRKETLKEARKLARDSRRKIVIKAGSTKFGYMPVATIDGRFYMAKSTI